MKKEGLRPKGGLLAPNTAKQTTRRLYVVCAIRLQDRLRDYARPGAITADVLSAISLFFPTSTLTVHQRATRTSKCNVEPAEASTVDEAHAVCVLHA